MSTRFDGNSCPAWVRTRRNRPTDYNRLYDELKEFNGTVKTEKVSHLLQKSGLQSQQLDRIWNLINNKNSYLSEQEFCILLAFVGLSQKGTHVFDIKTLFKLGQPPTVPDFSKSVQSGQGNSSRHIQSQPQSPGQMYSFINQSQLADSSNDDEFSEFQSGLTVTSFPDVTTPSHPPTQFSQKVIPFSPVHIHSKPEVVGTEVGSRLANYDLGYTLDSHRKSISTTNSESLLGEEDKYSAFRVFLEDDRSPGQLQAPLSQPLSAPAKIPTTSLVQPSVNTGDLDFGDFQSFTDTTSERGAYSNSSLIDTPLSIPTIIPIVTNPFRLNLNLSPVQAKPEEIQDHGDDFGEFVSFTDNIAPNPALSTSEATFKPVPAPVVVPASKPSSGLFANQAPSSVFPSYEPFANNTIISTLISNKVNLLEQDLNNLELTNTTYDFMSQSVEIQDSPVTKVRSANNSNLAFPFDLGAPSPMKFPLKTTKIGNSSASTNITLLDPFEEFTSFESASENSNNINRGSTMILEQGLSTSAYEIKLKQSSPETQSVCSLDLGNYGSWEFPEGRKSTENIDSEFPRFEIQPSKGSQLFSSGDDNDKYNCFKEELETTKARCTTAWKRCMKICVKLIESAGTIFNSVSSSDVIRQVISSEKGHLYVLSLREVYLVACRIYHSWMKLSADDIAGVLHQKLALAWDSFVPFLVGTPLEDNVNQACVISEDDLTDSTHVCGICLIGTKVVDNFEEDVASLLLDYGGSIYHLACANLWVNEVDSVLPSLYK